MITVPSGVTLTPDQLELLERYASELEQMNRRINLVSREDVSFIASRHVPHCLTLAIRRFPAGAVVADWGTGGGLPLIPLAVAFPDVRFIGIDAVAKKVQAVRHFARRLGLANVEAWHGRAEEFPGRADFSVSRATAPLQTLWDWHSRVVPLSGEMPDEASWPRGSLVCLKGGELDSEASMLPYGTSVERIRIAPLLSDGYFQTKEIVCVTTS